MKFFAGLMAAVGLSMRLAGGAQIDVDAAEVTQKISPLLYGGCTEDVNHEIYGGLYDQRLFGESFEEPPPPAAIEGWKSFDGDWNGSGASVFGKASDGGKLVSRDMEIADGTVEFEVRMEGGSGGDANAGAIVRVRDAAAGADAFAGYEVSLARDGKRVILGRHEQNFAPLEAAAVSVDATRWQRLRVELVGPRVRIFLNAGTSPVIDFCDPRPLPAGQIGLRTWRGDAEFRNVTVRRGAEVLKTTFATLPSLPVSGMWDPVEPGAAQFQVDDNDPFNGRWSQRIRHLDGPGMVGVANRGLNRWGIAVRKDSVYVGSIHLRGSDLKGGVVVALQSADGARTYARQTFEGISSSWKKFPFGLPSTATDANARFVVMLDGPGTLWIDQAVLMGPPAEQFQGLPLRKDIAEAIKAQGIRFLRYGGTMVNAPEYRWKNMIGDRDRRPPCKGHWYPHSTNGFGIEEFVAFCEKAGFEPAFAINVEETPEDMANMIEYLNGPVTSEWGGRRAKNGHPKPYGVKCIEIGNEEVIWGDVAADYDHYVERFQILAAAMKAKDPNLTFVNAAWWRGNNPNCERVFRRLEGVADYWDIHTWADKPDSGGEVDRMLSEARDLFQRWVPGAKMKVVIFEENGNRHDVARALGHATTLNAVRRHGDFVAIDCAANLLQPWRQNDNGWDQGQVFFTADKVWGMPPFYAQQMAARNHQPLLVRSEVRGDQNLDVTATKSDDGRTLCLHVVNMADTDAATTVRLKDFANPRSTAKAWTLAGALDARNSPDEPEKIRSIEKTISNVRPDFTYSFPPHSYTVLRLER